MRGDEAGREDLLERLAENDGFSLAFRVGVGGSRRVPGDALLPVVEAACGEADLQSRVRRPAAPVTSRTDTGAKGAVLVELTNPSRDPGEAAAWLADLDAGLASASWPVRVAAVRFPRRLPTFSDTYEWPPALSAYVNFVSDWDVRLGTGTPPEALTRNAAALVEWCRLPGADLVLVRDGVDLRCTAASAADELLVDWPEVPLRILIATLKAPRRLRLVDFADRAQGHLQVLDVTRSPVELLPELLRGLVILAPHTSYAYVRHGSAAGPDVYDVGTFLGREPTANETAMRTHSIQHLFAEYAPDAYVAQVLTQAHLDKVRSLDLFTTEPLGDGRFLVVATEPEPWIAGVNPDPDVLAAARHDFGPMLVTPEVLAQRPPFWLRARPPD